VIAVRLVGGLEHHVDALIAVDDSDLFDLAGVNERKTLFGRHGGIVDRREERETRPHNQQTSDDVQPRAFEEILHTGTHSCSTTTFCQRTRQKNCG
jgi:hypothetical protein